MKTALKFALPAAFCLVGVASYWFGILLFRGSASLFGALLGALLGGIFLGVLALTLLCLAVPVFCVIYAKRLSVSKGKRLPFALYNALLLAAGALPFLAWQHALLLLAWASIWSLLPLFFFKK